ALPGAARPPAAPPSRLARDPRRPDPPAGPTRARAHSPHARRCRWLPRSSPTPLPHHLGGGRLQTGQVTHDPYAIAVLGVGGQVAASEAPGEAGLGGHPDGLPCPAGDLHEGLEVRVVAVAPA